MENNNQKLPTVSPLPEDQEIVDEIRSEVTRLRKDSPDASAQVLSGEEQTIVQENLEQAKPVRSPREVRPMASEEPEISSAISSSEDKPSVDPKPEIERPNQQPQREIPTPSTPQKEIPQQPISAPEVSEDASAFASEEQAESQTKKKRKKSIFGRKHRKEKEREQALEQDLEEDIYQGVHIRSFDEIRNDMLQKGSPKVSEPTSSFSYLFDNTQDLPPVLLSKTPEELKREREERAQQAVVDALAQDPKAEENEISAEIEAEGTQQNGTEHDGPILIDGFDYDEWKRTTQSLPKITDEMIAAYNAESEKNTEKSESDTLPITVHPKKQNSEKLPIDFTHNTQPADSAVLEVAALMEQALADTAEPESALNINEDLDRGTPTNSEKKEPKIQTPAPETPVQAETSDAEKSPLPSETSASEEASALSAEASVPKTELPANAPTSAPASTEPVTEEQQKVSAPVSAETKAKSDLEATLDSQPDEASTTQAATTHQSKTMPEDTISPPLHEEASPSEAQESFLAQEEPEPVANFVPVADPERYRFQKVPVRTFRIDQINEILASELETFCHPEKKKKNAPTNVTPQPTPSEKAASSEAVREKPSPSYGKVISLSTEGGIEAAIAAAIQRADAADTNLEKTEEVQTSEQVTESEKKEAPAEQSAPVSEPAVPETTEPLTPETPASQPDTPAQSSQGDSAQDGTENPVSEAQSEAEEESILEKGNEEKPSSEPLISDEDPLAQSDTDVAEKTTQPVESNVDSSAAATPSEELEESESAHTSAPSETAETTNESDGTAAQTESSGESDEESQQIFEKIASFPKPAKKEETATLANKPPQTLTSPAMEIPMDSGSEWEEEPEKKKFSFFRKEKQPGKSETSSEFHTNTEEEYTPQTDPKQISLEIKTATKELHIRTIVTGFFTAALLILAFVYEKCIPATASPLPYLILNLAFVVIPAAVCAKTIWNGIKALFSLQGNTDSGISIAVLATIVHAVSLFFGGHLVMGGLVHIYSAIAVGALLLNTIGKLSMMNRIARNFIFVTSAEDKCSVEIYEDINIAIQLAKGCVSEAPKIAYQQKTKFLKNFLKHSYESDPSMRTSQMIAPIALVASIVLCIVTIIITGSVIMGLTALSVATCISAPIASLLCVNLPVANLCNLARRHGAMLVGYEAVEKLSSTNAVMLDSTDLFPKNSVSLADIKVYAGRKIDKSILNAAAVMSNTGGTLRDLFEGVITSQKEMLPKATDITYLENKGMGGIVAGKRILVGNQALMEENGIKVPREPAPTKANHCVIYLAEEKELMAMLTVAYEPDQHTVYEMQRLESCGIAAIIRTLDPNLTPAFLSTLFLVEESTLKVLPAELGDCCDEALQNDKDACDALLATRGKAFSMMRLLSACVRQKHNISISVTMQIVSVILGFVLVAFLSCYAGLQQLSTLAILIYEAVWLAAIIIIPKLRKP